jgi:hypothetical protein
LENKMIKNKKQMIVAVLFFASIILLISYVSAYKMLCLKYGEAVPSKENPRYTCHSDMCPVCVTDNNFPTHPGFCYNGGNGVGGNCEPGGGGPGDLKPPILTINSPVDNQIYNTKQVVFDLTTDEPASILYTDNINGRGVWKKIASGVTAYKRGVSFKDGLNDITIRAADKNGNSIDIIRKFTVDSTKPKIKKTFPKKGFADGNFEVQFAEKNPTSLKLNYGDKIVNLNLDSCTIEKGINSCKIKIDLSSFNNQKIDYWFTLTDIANNVVESKPVSINVDTSNPIINNPDSMYTQNGKNIFFSIDITEPNLESVSYIDNSAKKPKFTKLCSSLKNGICTKKVSFSIGNHDLDIQVIDSAGNSVTKSLTIAI